MIPRLRDDTHSGCSAIHSFMPMFTKSNSTSIAIAKPGIIEKRSISIQVCLSRLPQSYILITFAFFTLVYDSEGGAVAQWLEREWSRVRIPLAPLGNFAIYFTLCQCLSEETPIAVVPFYLVSMSAEVKYPI